MAKALVPNEKINSLGDVNSKWENVYVKNLNADDVNIGDDSVKNLINNLFQNKLDNNNGTITIDNSDDEKSTFLTKVVSNGFFDIGVATDNEAGPRLRLYGNSASDNPAGFDIQARYDTVVDERKHIICHNLSMKKNGSLWLKHWDNYSGNEYDLGSSAIVAKSLGVNGYVKYASGLIFQWGKTTPEWVSQNNGKYKANILMNISFSSLYNPIISVESDEEGVQTFRIDTYSPSAFTLYMLSNVSFRCRWLAIGY